MINVSMLFLITKSIMARLKKNGLLVDVNSIEMNTTMVQKIVRNTKELMTFIKTIFGEMAQGNFSFAILIVGIAQIFAMIRSKKS